MPETLREVVSRGPVDPSIALSILRQLLNALEFAHWRGVVLGDIAPESVDITSGDEETLASFADAQEVGGSARTQADLSASTAAYLAPEQINLDPPDERTDIFALGVVAYEMFTGKHPFGASDGLSVGAVMDRILHADPLEIPQTTLAGLPRRIPPVLAVALAKQPEDRFPDAVSFLDALKGPSAIGEEVALPGKPALPSDDSPRGSRLRRKWLVASALGGLAVAALVLWWALALRGDSDLGCSAAATSGSTVSTAQSVSAIVSATTTSGVAPTTSTVTTVTTTTGATTSATATSTTTSITATSTTTSTAASTTTTIATPIRHEQTESPLVFTGTWSTTADVAASGGSFLFADAGGASVSVTFDGTYLAWIAKKAPAYGKASVTLDGKTLGTVDLYSADTRWQQKVWGSGTLKPGRHTVIIAWTGAKNAAATGTNVGVDAFDVVGSLTQAP